LTVPSYRWTASIISFEHRVEELARVLRITIGEQFHGALQIGEEDRDLFALALERGLRGQDLLGRCLGV
jgi:hypothetical protein